MITPSPWPPELIEQVRTYAGQGLSSNKIAQLLGKSRNAVIGICQRQHIQLGMQMVNRVQSRRKSPKPKPEPKSERKPVKARVSVVNLAKRAERAAAKEPQPTAVEAPVLKDDRTYPHKVRYFDVTAHQCRFPLWGDDKNLSVSERFFCGSGTIVESPYCADCRSVMYRGTEARAA